MTPLQARILSLLAEHGEKSELALWRLTGERFLNVVAGSCAELNRAGLIASTDPHTGSWQLTDAGRETCKKFQLVPQGESI